jgi:carbohydrate-selective porin OprB
LCLSSFGLHAEESATPDEFDADPMVINNPGSIVERVKEDYQDEDYLFTIPGGSKLLEPWRNFKNKLAEEQGLKFGVSYTSYYQKTSENNLGPEDDAASYDLDISGNWAFTQRGTGSEGLLGFSFFKRDSYGSKIPPQRLFSQVGSLYSSAAPYGENDFVLGELWIQKKFNNKWGFRVGKLFPITAYDFFPFKNFRTDFVDFHNITNAAIPLPGNGYGGFIQYRPMPRLMLRLGVHDANADVEKSGIDTWDGETFKIIEAHWDTGLAPRTPGKPPAGVIAVRLWQQDERDDAGIDDGWGISTTVNQKLGRYTPFVRLGYANVDADGPTPAELVASTGIAIDGIFGQANDRIGIAYTWSDPADALLDHENMIDAYYRVQLTPTIEFGPTLEYILKPVRDPEEDSTFILGARARIAF